jgi:hypothetical protein
VLVAWRTHRTDATARWPRYAITGPKTQTQMNAAAAPAAAPTSAGQSDAAAGRPSVVTNTMADKTVPMIVKRFVSRTAFVESTSGWVRQWVRECHPVCDDSARIDLTRAVSSIALRRAIR